MVKQPVVKARRNYKCGYCGQMIKKGENYIRTSSSGKRLHAKGQCYMREKKRIREIGMM